MTTSRLNYCNTCSKPLLPGRACKTCDINTGGKVNRRCGVTEYGRVCGSVIDIMRANPGQDPSFFMCGVHYERLRSKSAIELEIDHRAKVYADAQKESGMTQQEFAFDVLEGYGFTSKMKKEDAMKKIKEILAKQNPLLAMNVEVRN